MKKGGFALDEMVVNDFVRKLMQFGRGPHPYRGYGRKSQVGGIPRPQYNFSTLQENPNSLDSFNYLQAFNQALVMPQGAYDEKNTLPAHRLAMQAPVGSPDAMKWLAMSGLYGNAYKDAHTPSPLTPQEMAAQAEAMKKLQAMSKKTKVPMGAMFKKGGRRYGY